MAWAATPFAMSRIGLVAHRKGGHMTRKQERALVKAFQKMPARKMQVLMDRGYIDDLATAPIVDLANRSDFRVMFGHTEHYPKKFPLWRRLIIPCKPHTREEMEQMLVVERQYSFVSEYWRELFRRGKVCERTEVFKGEIVRVTLRDLCFRTHRTPESYLIARATYFGLDFLPDDAPARILYDFAGEIQMSGADHYLMTRPIAPRDGIRQMRLVVNQKRVETILSEETGLRHHETESAQFLFLKKQ